MRRERAGAVAGVVAVLLLGVSYFLTPTPPKAAAPVGEIAEHFFVNRLAIEVAAYMTGLALAAVLWFVGTLRGYLSRSEGDQSTMILTAFGAGIATVAMQWVATAVSAALAFQVAERASPPVVSALYDLLTVVAAVAWFPVAVMVGVTSAIGFRTRALPWTLGAYGILVAAGALLAPLALFVKSGPFVLGGPMHAIVNLAFLVWLLAVSTVVLQRPAAAPLAASGEAA